MVPKPLGDSGLAGDVPGGLGRFLGKGKGLAALSAPALRSRLRVCNSARAEAISTA